MGDIADGLRIDLHGGRDAILGNGFARRGEVIRDSENERRAVVEGNQFLLGGGTESIFADGVAAVIIADSCGENFRRAASEARIGGSGASARRPPSAAMAPFDPRDGTPG